MTLERLSATEQDTGENNVREEPSAEAISMLSLNDIVRDTDAISASQTDEQALTDVGQDLSLTQRSTEGPHTQRKITRPDAALLRFSSQTLRSSQPILSTSLVRSRSQPQTTAIAPAADSHPLDLNRPLPSLPDTMSLDHPPPYEPAGPPPEYIESDCEDDSMSFKRDKMRTCGARWWLVGIVGCDLVFTVTLLLVTLAELSTNPTSLSAASVILPFIYSMFAVYGKISVAANRLTGRIIYTIIYVMRWSADVAGLVLFCIRSVYHTLPSTASPTEQRSVEWVVEGARVPVVGMRAAQYGDISKCALGGSGCLWRVGVFGGMLVIHLALATMLCSRLYIDIARGRQRRRRQAQMAADFATSVLISPRASASPEDLVGVTVLPSMQSETPREEQFADLTHVIGDYRTRMSYPPTTPIEMVHFDREIFRPRPVSASAHIRDTHSEANEGGVSRDSDDDERPLSHIIAEMENERTALRDRQQQQ